MSLSVYDHIRKLIEDTNAAYDGMCSSGLNADFAEFAALALSDFRAVLGNDALSEAELIMLLREGRARHKSITPNTSWSGFLATYIGHRANSDRAIIPARDSWEKQTG
jgi:hypothetical protein